MMWEDFAYIMVALAIGVTGGFYIREMLYNAVEKHKVSRKHKK